MNDHYHQKESLYHNIEETLYALRFAQFLQTIQCCIVPNKSDIRVEYYRRCLFDIIHQYEAEKAIHIAQSIHKITTRK